MKSIRCLLKVKNNDNNMKYNKVKNLIWVLPLLLLISSCNKNDNIPKTITQDTVKKVPALDSVKDKPINHDSVIVQKDYSDINVFWADFKEALVKKDKQKIADMTFFPFMNQSPYINKDEFLSDFQSIMKQLMASPEKLKSPRKSGMSLGGGFDSKGKSVNIEWKQGSLMEVRAPASYYFGKSKGVYKFIGVIYGE